ncbi:hypothetical protein EDC22_106115 [Tepidamorphus gemmatus]|uniref:Uncharacterized protein n=1 Tax=Tepidamorphus gemmatus TaxID=747076 RepID=A0A4R3M8P0_9HYPH|nr:hypothetical protein [Tepidamorphus gemmatus]TCT09921.1 hypothetical protein EDC22_106115 [Tepidamorphus gemmatus]
MNVIIGLALLVGSIWLLQRIRPRDGRPGAAFLQHDAVATAFALGFTTALVFGAALAVLGAVQLWNGGLALWVAG